MDWYYIEDNKQVGPFADANFEELIRSRRICHDTPVWTESMPEWEPASQTHWKSIIPPPLTPPPIPKSPPKDIKFICPECGKHLVADAKLSGFQMICPDCQKKITVPKKVAVPYGGLPFSAAEAAQMFARVSARISSAAGVEKVEGFSFKETFSEVFKKHSDDDVERYFSVGGPETTPSIVDVDPNWPKPWVFFRTLILAVTAYFAFVQAWGMFSNLNLLPGLIIVGSFAVPFSTLLFFFETNVRRNISLFQLNKLVFVGGVFALIFSLFMFEVTSVFKLQWLGASVAGIAEEPGKLVALALIVRNRKYPYILNGLLFGAAIGVGFAAFESAGYAFRVLIESETSTMKDIIMTRGILSPFGHIAWTAMNGAALWRVKGNNPFQFEMLKDDRFLRIFATSVVLHMVWNCGIPLPFYGTQVILGVVAWIIILGLIQEGLKQVRAEKAIKLDSH